jgi:hypothetical protein
MRTSLQIRLWLFAIVMFFFGIYTAYREFRYAISGETTQATVVDMFETRGRRGRTTRHVRYQYTDAEATQKRTGSDAVADGAFFDRGQAISIQYLPGEEDSSRLSGHRNYVGLVIFAVSIGAMTFAGFKLYQSEKESRQC